MTTTVASEPIPVGETTAARVADGAGIDAAVRALDTGLLVGLPTETVYGLAADALDAAAVLRVFAAKNRPADNPLIVHVADPAELAGVAAHVTPLARSLATTFWPGPLTLVLEAHERVPAVTRGGLHTVAVRLPDHPVAAAVLERTRHPLAAPSANRSGRPSPTRAEHVVAEFGDRVAVVLDGGPCILGVESTVVDVRGRNPVVLREGTVTREQLGVATQADTGDLHRAPGTRYRHYAPRCPVVLVEPGALADLIADLAPSERVRTGVVAPRAVVVTLPPDVPVVATYDDEVDLARGLYVALRDAEDAGVERLVIQTVAERGVGRAVMDRLRRAAGQD